MTGLKPKLTPEQARQDHVHMMRFLAFNALSGMALGVLVTAGVLYFDVAGMGSRIARSSEPLLPLLLIGIPMALTCGGAVTATAIWTMPYQRRFAPEPRRKDEDEGPDPRP